MNTAGWKVLLKWLIGGILASALVGSLFVAMVFILASQNLPSIDPILNYKPKMPLRIYTADNYLIGEFGQEQRDFIAIEKMPKNMKNAIVAIEDERFYRHSGIDYYGLARATLSNLKGNRGQGASTITMQVAREFFLSRDRSINRKIYEVLLAKKIESNLSKDKILELYMNQIYLGQRSYGFGAAAKVYFGKPLSDVTIAQAAMLAGLPKAPSAYNPVVNYKRAKIRQEYILKRMLEQGYISQAQHDAALTEKLNIRTSSSNDYDLKADYVAEQVRLNLYQQLGNLAYTKGYSVYTTIYKSEQEAASSAAQKAIRDYDRRQGYRGPEGYIELPEDVDKRAEAIDDALNEHPDANNYFSAVVLSANTKKVQAMRASGDIIDISGDGLRVAIGALAKNAPAKMRIQTGSIIRINYDGGRWILSQLPEVQAAFVSIDSENGAIRSMVGGFDFSVNKFNHVTQAQRQPGSSFKPFIYSAGIEKGFTGMTVINDGPLSLPSGETGGQPWEPKNYDGNFDGPMTMRKALAKSKNMVSIRILRSITPKFAQTFITNFGFAPEKHLPYLPMALGAGSVTPLELAGGYAVFANGGYRIEPYLVKKIIDNAGKVVFNARPKSAGNDAIRSIDERNAYIMHTLLQGVVNNGTAVMAKEKLKRTDLAGKTGTTNNSVDAWFAGYGGKIVGVAWMGFDNPRSLGAKETGGGLALPIWVNYMQTALKNQPIYDRVPPDGLTQVGEDWVYTENMDNGAVVRSLDNEAIMVPGSQLGYKKRLQKPQEEDATETTESAIKPDTEVVPEAANPSRPTEDFSQEERRVLRALQMEER